MTTELFNINLSQSQKVALRRRAALMTAETGKLITMSELVRDLIDQMVVTPIHDATPDDDKSNSIKFTPLPPVARAIRQAHINSGRPVGEVVNQMLAEALHAEGVSL